MRARRVKKNFNSSYKKSINFYRESNNSKNILHIYIIIYFRHLHVIEIDLILLRISKNMTELFNI